MPYPDGMNFDYITEYNYCTECGTKIDPDVESELCYDCYHN